ncbi:MAG: response regulator [Methylibium sp.]|nr:response regulator [Methylibium sp.]
MLEPLAARLGLTVDPDVREYVADEQLKLVWAHAAVSTLIATAFAAVMAIHLSGSVDAHLVQLWLALKVIVAVPRVVQAHLFRRLAKPGGQAWRLTTWWMQMLDGAVWGLGGFWLMGSDINTASLVTASLCCVACVATFGLQVSRAATAAYVAPIIVPMILGMALRGDSFGVYGAVGLALFLAQILITSKRAEGKFVEIFLLRLHAAKVSAELEKALELAQRQSSVKSQFLGTVSHELRTPVHGMLGLARLVHVETGDPLIKKRMELIETSGTHLLSLVTELLDITRIEAGQMRLQRVEFDLNAEVARVGDIYTVRAAEKGLAFTLDSKVAGPCWVTGDPSRTRQVLHNLLGNAIKFTHKGWVHLMFECCSADGEVRFEVRDTGLGISDEDQATIFNAFRQIGGASTSRMEGTGLGLTIAREIARLLGGDITVSSRPGFGSIFRFTARFAPIEAGVPAPKAQPDVLAPPVAAPSRILLVEDNDVNALIATSMLANHGHRVERVSDGAEAVRRALREIDRPQLVLMDCMMPVMDGFEAARSIRVQEKALGLDRVPIIALSALLQDEGEQRCADAGMDDALPKPFTDVDLQRIVGAWLAPAPHGVRSGRLQNVS